MDFQILKDSPIPLHLQLLNELRRMIMAGEVKPHSRLISEPQLATTLNISRTTIRQAWQAAEEQGLLYRVPGKGTYIAEPADKRAAQVIGFLNPGFASTFDSKLLSGAESYLRSRGYRVMFAHTDRNVREENRLMQEMSQEGVQGFLMWPAMEEDVPRFLQNHDVPTVFMDRPIPGLNYPCVAAEHYSGAVQAMQHLIELGHKDIAFVARPHLQLWSISERLRAYDDMMRSVGLKPRPPILVGSSVEVGAPHAQQTYEQSSGKEITQLQAVLRRNDHPTALFAMNDLMAIQVVRAANLVGLNIPADLSVVGFDDLEIVAHLQPPLTTVAQDPFQIGQEAARVLLDVIGGSPPADPNIFLPTHLVVRNSTAYPSVKLLRESAHP